MYIFCMFCVYVLISRRDKKLYIGYTNNLKNRLFKHKNGFVRSTKHRRPISLIYFETYNNEVDAKKRELYLKGGKGHKDLKVQLKETFMKSDYPRRF